MSKLYLKPFPLILSLLFFATSLHINAKDFKSTETTNIEKKDETEHLISVRGFVVDDFGEPMVGVEVYATGSEKKGITNTEGKYTVWAYENDTLKFSQIGIVTKKETVTSSRILNVALSIEEE